MVHTWTAVPSMARFFITFALAAEAIAVVATGPCDIFNATGTPCVAAHSTVRALFGNYDGPLYQVVRLADKAAKDISVKAPGGYADSASQDAFCGAAQCVIWRIYDQTAHANHLDIAPPGGAHPARDSPVNATKERLVVGGHTVYAAYFEGGMGYRIDNTSGVAKGDEAETIYMVTSGTHYNDRYRVLRSARMRGRAATHSSVGLTLQLRQVLLRLRQRRDQQPRRWGGNHGGSVLRQRQR
jgi:hypothetical protein